MSSTTEFAKITPGQQNCKVFGRLIRLWDAKNMSPKAADPFISIDGIILAEDGTMAEISVPRKVEKQFRPLLQVGSVYIFTDLNAVDSTHKKYIYHHQNYMLQFKSSSKVHLMQSRGASIPQFAFDFCQFDKLSTKDIPTKPLIDLIGVISYVGPYDYASPVSQYKLRKIHIRNQDEQTQQINLWGEHGQAFDESTVLAKSKEKIVVCAFAGLTTGKFLGKIEASSSSATQTFIDLDIPEVAQYISSYQWEIPTLQQQKPQVVRQPPIQAAGKIHKLEEISALPISSFQGGATYSCIAKIEAVIQSSKWYYKTCKTCGQGYNNNLDTPRCTCPFSAPKPMFKLPLKITDGTTSMDTIAFTAVAEDLVDKTASEASQNMKIDASDHAVALDQAIGKTRLFTIGMNPEYFSKFSINYVLKKSYPVDGQNLNTISSAPQDPADKNALALPSPTNTNLSHSPVITTPHAESSSSVTHQILDESSDCPDVDNPITCGL
ncbi:uncharacterized protein [Lolium perenne]|uniref:uncharacterized protein n=1 Tax=Lolium perenne TaxID=4522 RepID=UPI003A99F6FE